jgi:hypothetical protein
VVFRKDVAIPLDFNGARVFSVEAEGIIAFMVNDVAAN